MMIANKNASWALFWTVSLFGTPFFYVPATAYLFKSSPKTAINILLMLAFTELICGAIKYIYPKERPVPMPRNTLFQKYLAGSFPSVHTARISAFSIGILPLFINKPLVLAALALLIISVGYSRIYLKKHYLIDVLGGFGIAAAIGIAVLAAKNYLNLDLDFSAMGDLGFFLLKCFYFMMPAYFANMAPVMVKKIDLLAFPIDFNRKLGSEPVLGKNKTFRGLFFGVIFAIIAAYVQFLLYNEGFFRSISFFSYENWLLLGFLMGFGALTGDLIKSFFKRRLGIKPGARFIPFDQTDFVIGALVFAAPAFKVTLSIFLASLFVSFIGHIIVNHAAFCLKIRNEKW